MDKDMELEGLAGEKKDSPRRVRRRVCPKKRLHQQTYSIVSWLENNICNPFEDGNKPKRHT